jgi:serine/threonine protein kinase
MISHRQLDRVRTILAAAIKLPASDRGPFARAQCGDDQEVRSEVESLLGLHEIAGDFLNTPLPEAFGAEDLPPQTLLSPGVLIKGRYRLQQILAESGFATVYLANDETVARKPVVVKVLDRLRHQPAIQDAFEAELQSLSRLTHPHVAGLTDVGELADGTPFLIMSYIPGETLRHALRNGPLPSDLCRTVLQGVGAALAAAHRAGIWHLDVKPENIIISDAGTPEAQVTLVDFGIANFRAMPARAAATTRYMAPEQLIHPSARCDLYSLALVAAEMLTGRLPDTSQPVAPQLRGPQAMRAAIAQALSTDPAARQEHVTRFLQQALDEPRGRKNRHWLAVVAATLLAVAAVVAWMPFRKAPRPPVRAEPMVSTPGFKHFATFSPDGEWIYYSAGLGNQLDIYRQRIGSGAPSPVVTHRENDNYPAISPDGKYLAFVRGISPHSSLILRALDGSETEVELRADTNLGNLCWHPNSRQIIVADGGPDDHIGRLAVVDIRSRSYDYLFPAAIGVRGDRNPAISPDGRFLAFSRRFNQQSADMFILEIDERLKPRGEARRITYLNERIMGVQWTPDSRELIYLSGPLGHGSLKRLSLSGGTPEPVLGAEDDIDSVAIPARAWKLAYGIHRADSNLWRMSSSPSPAATRLPLASNYDDEEPRLSPDGKMLAFSSSRTGSEEIWIARPDGTDPRQVTAITGTDAIAAVWSRDSRQLIISVLKKGHGDRVYLANPETLPTLRPLLTDARVTDVSHDGRWLYVFRKLENSRRIWKVAYPQPGEFIPVTSTAADFGREAADGRSLYFGRRNESEGLWLQPLPSGTPRQIAKHLYRRNLFVPAPDGVYYIAPPDAQPYPSLHFWSAATGTATPLLTFPADIFWGIDLSSKRELYYSQFDVANADIMLVNDFR